MGDLINIMYGAGLMVRGVVAWDKCRAAYPYRGRDPSTGGVFDMGWQQLPRSDIYLDGVVKHTTKTNGKARLTEKPLSLMRDLN